MRVVAAVIVRNERRRYLDLHVRHLLEFCDEIRVLDDGSTDGTNEYLTDIHDPRVKVLRLDCVRDTGSDFHRHAENRQRLLQFALEAGPGFLLAIDADEFVSDGHELRRFCDEGPGVLSLAMREAWNVSDEGLKIREDHLWRPREVSMLWHTSVLGQHQRLIKDRGPATGRTPEALNELRSRTTGVTCFHFGWSNLSERASRYQRYVEHDGGNYHNRRHLDSIMWDDRQVRTAWRPWPAGLQAIKQPLIDRTNEDWS